MAQFQNLVQFAPTPGLGQPMKGVQPNTLNARINPSSVATGLQVGSPFKLIANTATAEIIIDLAASTDKVFGVLPANTKKNTYASGDVVDLFCEGNILLLESTAAVNAGDLLAISNTSSGGAPGVTATVVPGTQYGGVALNSVSAATKLVLVQLKSGVVPTITASHAGTFAAPGAGSTTVTDATVTANSAIIITLKTVGGTIVGAPDVATITPGTGFTVTGGGASNTSIYNYLVIN